MEGMKIWARQVFLSVGSRWEPAIDVCEDEEAYHIVVDVAGVEERDLDVEYHPNGTLVIRGVRRPPMTGAVQCLVLEIPYGAFERQILLPTSVNADSITATYRNGLLYIRVPKLVKSAERVREVPIR
ncbi:MAG: hypothetical protein IMHGJWDQ_000923 [Candidatus Fervidibacter sp.]